MENIEVKIDDLNDGSVIALLQEHHSEMHKYSPPESIHALDMSGMKDPSITFWSAWSGNELAGCGALKELSSGHGEIKSMRTRSEFLRKGIAARILECILEEAQSRSYTRLSLETGTNEAFTPAVKLYQRFGFEECGPFGSYELDPYSHFFTKVL